MAQNQPRYLSLGAIATGDRHIQTRYLSPAGVSLHPLQRLGVVSALSSALTAFLPAAGPLGLLDSAYPAAPTPHVWPPVIPLPGSPRDPAMMV